MKDEDRQSILLGLKEGRAIGGPYHLELDPADVCNADCFFCNSVEWRRGDMLKWEVLEPCLDEMIAGGLRSFRLSGGGEPLVYPLLGKILEKMSAAGVVLQNLTTNGILLDRHTDSLIRLNPTNYGISLNYATAEQYGKFMRIPGDRFERILRNVNGLHEKLAAAGRRAEAQIHLQFFIHHSTIHDLEAMFKLAADHPFDTITLRTVGDLEEAEHLTDEDRQYFMEHLPKAFGAAEGKSWLMFGIQDEVLTPFCGEFLRRVHEKHLSAQKPRPKDIEYCYIGWYSMTIQGNGNVHPCCYIMPDQRVEHFGNINEKTVAEIWQGDTYQRFRREMRSAMVIQTLMPKQMSRFKCSLEGCWDHSSCSMSHDLADTDFYIAAHEVLEGVRRQPMNRLARLGARAFRKSVDGVRKFTK